MRTVLIILFSCFMLTITGCKEGKAQQVQKVELITVSDMEEVLEAEKVQLIDVRTKREFAGSHIKNSKNIVYQGVDWNKQVASLDKDKPVYVYCARGVRSAKCASILEDAGFTKIFDLDGGITKWINEGRPIE